MSEHNKTNGHAKSNGHEEKGDWIHFLTAHIEHLMDIFEIGIAVVVAFGFIFSVYPLMRELPLLGSMSTGTTAYRHFLESALDLVIGIEFIKMLIKHTPGSVVEVLLFALSRHMVLEGGNALENLLTVCAIAIIFAIRKFLFIESFEFLGEKTPGLDWLSDWKEIKKGGGKKVHKPAEKEKPDVKESASLKDGAILRKSAAANEGTALKEGANLKESALLRKKAVKSETFSSAVLKKTAAEETAPKKEEEKAVE